MANKKRNNFIRKKGNWYYRLILWNGVRQNEWTIPFKVKDKKVANRLYMKYLKPIIPDIRAGHIQKFQLKELLPWLNKKGTVKLIEKSMKDIVVEYLEYRSEMVRASTLKRDKSALNQLMNFIGYTKPVEELSYKDIEGKNGLIHHLRSKGCSDVGINTSLRHIRIFLTHIYAKEKLIPEPIKFKLIPKGVQLYHYVNESETNQIFHYIDEHMDVFYKRCFYFYYQTGMRPSEPFVSELVGDWCTISAEQRKNKLPMQLKLNEELKAILLEMQSFRNSKLHCKDANERACYVLSTKMKDIVKALGFTGKRLTIYSFRHAYAIRRITMTNGNIYEVMREMGHSNPQTTMGYLRFPEQRRLDDFPSLREYIEQRQNMPKSSIMGTKIMGTIYDDINKLSKSIGG